MKFKDLSNGGGKNFLKLKPGEGVSGVFRGEIQDFRQHWSAGRGVVCTGRDQCELCKAGEKSAFRFRVNFIIKENGALVAKTFEQGRAVYEAMKALHDGGYDLEHHFMKVTRFGSGTDTTYSIVPVPNGTLNADQEQQLSAVQLQPVGGSEAPQQEEGHEETEDDLPF